MRPSIKMLALGATMLGVVIASRDAHACSASETQVYQSATTAWCVENSLVSQSGTFPSAFYAYGDHVIAELVKLFGVPAQGVYTFEASVPTGGAHTGSECCGLGVTVTGDAFYGSAYGATGFWGYLLSLHESINDWTGQVTGGWPTDFWADHISAFPNSMDWHVMATLGALDNDANLTLASAAQKARFYPGGDSVDPRVGMFDTIFAMPGVDYSGMSRIFGYVTGDKMSWDGLGVANPDQKRSEYVAAYLSLGTGKSVLPTLQSANVCNGTDDGKSDPTYTCDEANIDAIATAHCAIAAAAASGSDESSDLAALRSGQFANVTAAGPCGAGCPSECGCELSTGRCVAPWLADALADGGALDAGSGSSGALDSGAQGGGGPDASLGGGNSGSKTGGGGDGDTTGPVPVDDSSGCGCTVIGGEHEAMSALSLTAIVGLLARMRSRRRKR